MVMQSVSVSCEPCAYVIHIITVETVGILVGRRLLQRAEVELGAAHDDQLELRRSIMGRARLRSDTGGGRGAGRRSDPRKTAARAGGVRRLRRGGRGEPTATGRSIR